MANLYAGSYLSMYVMLGYAVVASDYAGLGTTFRNAYFDGESNAADVIYSVRAARAAVPQLGRNWVLLGNSEGGLAVLAAAEMEHDLRDRGYLGGIAIAPPSTCKTCMKIAHRIR
jgi:alpha-beta hydrolase superfamily lysophospholipase